MQLTGRLWVSGSLLREIEAECTRAFPDETGGILLGYRGGADELVVTTVIGPGPNAHHSRYAFSPDHDFQEREVARIYRESGRNWNYLGDWHSHPGGGPRLSGTDRGTIARIASSEEARAPEPLMLVVCGSPENGWHVTPYRSRCRWLGRRMEVLTLCLFAFQS
jgi:integrative and conjugative element protein (TIGR02256 family)